MIEKPIAFIVSGGRTGTKFFANEFQSFFDSCLSIHEPDRIRATNLVEDSLYAARKFGLYQGLLGKASGRTGLRNVAERYLCGKTTAKEAIGNLEAMRAHFYEACAADFIVEANYAYFGLLELLPDVFKHYTVTAIARDPRDWIRSYLRKDDRYGSRDYLNRIGMRISATWFSSDPLSSRWKTMNPVERLAWYYNLVYSTILRAEEKDENVRSWRFEDLFEGPEKGAVLNEIARHASSFDHRRFQASIPANVLEKQANQSPNRRIPYSDRDISEAVEEFCPEVSRRFGYA